MIMDKIIKKEILELKSVLDKIGGKELKKFSLLCEEGKKTIKNNKIMFCGNGGSASDSQHLATELVVKYKKKRSAIPAMALTTDTSVLTAIGNDYDFKKIFSRQIEALGRKGDLLILITTSGNSQNLIEAAKVAKKKKIKIFCFSGNNGGKIKNYCKNTIIIKSNNTSLIQVVEIFLGQIFCGQLEKKIS
jgi:D-sedoheptulose 7-phosphate isomerase